MICNFLFENGIMWKNTVERGRPQMTLWLMRIACWILQVTNTHSEYVIQFFHCYNGWTNEPQCYIIRTLAVLSKLCEREDGVVSQHN